MDYQTINGVYNVVKCTEADTEYHYNKVAELVQHTSIEARNEYEDRMVRCLPSYAYKVLLDGVLQAFLYVDFKGRLGEGQSLYNVDVCSLTLLGMHLNTFYTINRITFYPHHRNITFTSLLDKRSIRRYATAGLPLTILWGNVSKRLPNLIDRYQIEAINV